MHDNPFKKKRGIGYIPDYKLAEIKEKENEGKDNHSLATASKLAMEENQNQEAPNRKQNDAVVAGTFGGKDGIMKYAKDENNSFSNLSAGPDQKSFYEKG